jgi:hypothetical protein
MTVSATDFQRHLMEACPSFVCVHCGQRGLLWRSLSDHEQREPVANSVGRTMAAAFSNASRHPAVSHHRDWLEVPKVVTLTCDLALKHRKHPARLEQLLLESHKTQRVLERLAKQWDEEDALAHVRRSVVIE